MTDIDNAYALITQYLDYLHRQYSPDELKAALAQRPRLLEMLRQLVDVGATPVPTPSTLAPFRTQGNQILYNDDPFYFAGCNIRELAWYSTPFMPHANSEAFQTQLNVAREIGFKVVRFYAPHNASDVQTATLLVRRTLDALQQCGMFAIVCLTDCAGSPFFVRDSPENFSGGYSHRFYGGGYNDHYLPFVNTLTREIGNHPAIFAWEICNEARTPFPPEPTLTQCQSILEFFAAASNTIAANSPEKLIATGLETCWQIFVTNAYGGQQFARKLYALSNIHLATLHTYHEDSGNLYGSAQDHIPSEMALNIPMIIEETGLIPHEAHLQPVFLQNLVAITQPRIAGYLQWAFQATHNDVGSGGRKRTPDNPGGAAMARTCDNLNPCFQYQPLVDFWTALARRFAT